MISNISLDPTLVGREKEINQLMKQLDIVLTGKGTVLFISGEAGVGKTRLVNEFLNIVKENQNIRIFTGWCLSEAAIPYFPFIEAFNQYFSEEGWIVYDSISFEVMKNAVESFEIEGKEVAQKILFDYFSPENVEKNILRLNRSL